MNNMNPFGTGAHESKQDPRTIVHSTMASPLTKGGVHYNETDIEHQHKVGICTAISLTQNRAKANGKKYSADFQYLLQKKLYDLAWYEGSSIFHALKVGKNIGFLPLELWTHTTENDRLLPYDVYVAKLQAIPDTEIERLKLLCVDKIKGYASVDVNNPQAIAKAIDDSEAGILCRYECGDTWWMPSWNPSDINPLRKPTPATSGHAIGMTEFDYSSANMQKLANTWGTLWNLKGNADINWSNYAMTEAWSILKTTPVIPPYVFTKVLRFGMKGVEVELLQKKLQSLGFFPATQTITGYYGFITMNAVKSFQTAHNLVPDGICGKNTNAELSK